MDQWIGASLARERFASMLLLLFAGLALVLAAIGIYGVMSYVVGQRTTEMGIRAALGASAGDIRRLILRDGARLLLAGLAIGAPLALAGSRALKSLLYETPGADPATFVVVLGVLAARGAPRELPARAARGESGAGGGAPAGLRPHFSSGRNQSPHLTTRFGRGSPAAGFIWIGNVSALAAASRSGSLRSKRVALTG